MSRVTMSAILLICAWSLACASGGPNALPRGCVQAPPNTVINISVGTNAKPSPSCVAFQNGANDIVWDGTNVLALLFVAFENNPTTSPRDPLCANAKCTLAKAETAGKSGNFFYGTLVRPKHAGPLKMVDPRLIIRP